MCSKKVIFYLVWAVCLFAVNTLSAAPISSFFALNTEELETRFHAAKRTSQESIQQILSISKEDRTFENTVLAFDKALSSFQIEGSMISVLAHVHPEKVMRQKAEQLLNSWTKCQIDLFGTNKEIYRAFCDFRSMNKEVLNEERAYYFSQTMRAFQRTGFELEREKFLELKKLQTEIAELSIQFRSNLAQDTPTLSFTREELQGIDTDFITTLPMEGEKYLVVCNAPTSFQVMTKCSVESTRRRYFHASNNRAYPQNLNILTKLIDRRDTLAKLLGYRSYAEFDIAPEMAETPERVEQFFAKHTPEAHQKAASNWTKILSELPEGVHLTQDGKIQGWDVAYAFTCYVKKQLNVDHTRVCEYFPLQPTLQALFACYGQFFSLRFQVVEGGSFWDSSVQTIEVRDAQAPNRIIGHILLDLFPRENKDPYCFCTSLIPQGAERPALAMVVASFSKATATKPSLLTHRDIQTLFHEFGHAIHALLGKSEMPTKAAYNTTTDFVETPSQLLEEWVWDRQILKKISCHYQTKEAMPDALIEGLLQTRTLACAAHFATGGSDHIGTELFCAKLSLRLFQEGKNKNLEQIEKDIYLSTPQIVAYDPEIHCLCRFVHLTDYGAKYYSYPWSKQIAKEIFAYIQAHGGLLNQEVGQRYVAKILCRGGSCHPELFLREFLFE